MFFDAVEKAGLNGIAAGALTLPIFGNKAQVFVPFANSEVPLSAMAFAMGACGSLAGDVVHKFINEEVDISEKWKDRTSLIAGVAINAGLFYSALCMFDSKVCEDFGALTALCVGGGAELIGSGTYSYLKENLYL